LGAGFVLAAPPGALLERDEVDASLREAKRRSNPALAVAPLDCFASLAMTIQQTRIHMVATLRPRTSAATPIEADRKVLQRKRASLWFVMPGLVPGIHVLAATSKKDVDGRDKSGHDGK
jgi:hypothetical protein